MELTEIPSAAIGLKLYRIAGDRLIACEAVRFIGGRAAVVTTLNRAAISGRVEVGGEIANHFADVLDEHQDMIETVSLDARSYGMLKNRWMRCRVDHDER